MCKMDTDQRLQNLTPQLAACTSHLWGFLFLEIYMDKMREEFEAWAKSEGIDINVFADGEQNAGEYYFLEAHCAWRSWLASRAALRVELPGAWILAEHEYKRQVEESLDSAGVSYE